MTIRSKLIVLLTVPVVALAIVAIWAFRDVNTDSEVLEDTVVSVTAISDLDDLWSDLSYERLAVLADEGVFEAFEETDMALERLSSQPQSGAAGVATDVLEALPANRRSTTPQEYGLALDIVEAGLAEQSLSGLTADSVLRNIFMAHARNSARTQEEAWIDVLGEEELDQDQVRTLLVASRDAVAARDQSAADRLSDGTRLFADATTLASGTDLGELEASFAVQSSFSGSEVESIVSQAASQLTDDEIFRQLVDSRNAWAEASEMARIGMQGDVRGDIATIDETRSLAIFTALLGGFLLFTLLFVVGRSITGPLNRLMQNAEVVTHDRLPAAVAQLRTLGASDDDVSLAPIPKESNDEIGTITDAFNDIQTSALRVATDQARSRRNVAEMFVSLGRRNQQLNQRLIAMISDMQQDEQDPEALKSLYNLDNVATRMRRNAESLLVLAGNRSPRQWSKPVPFDDVVRSSLAEVEYFDRVDVEDLPEISMAGNVVADVTHMLAELLDNATQFSDPTTTVQMSGFETAIGVRLEIADKGFGIVSEDLVKLNERLSNPPELDKAPSRLLGLFVVGRLAEQHGIDVVLTSNPGEGTTAIIDIPHNHFPTEVGENPIDISAPPIEVNADNASSFFDAAPSASDDLPIDISGSDDLPIEVAGADEDAEAVEVPEEVSAEVEPPEEVEAPEAEGLAQPEPVAVSDTNELPSRPMAEEAPAQAAATTTAAAADEDGSSFNPLKNDSWPVTQSDPLPTRDERPMEAVQREAKEEVAETVAETSIEESVQVQEAVTETEAASSDGASSLAALPTRMPQATIEAASTETAVIPLDIAAPADESAGSAAPSAFGSFAKGVEAGLEDVNQNSDQGEDA